MPAGSLAEVPSGTIWSICNTVEITGGVRKNSGQTAVSNTGQFTSDRQPANRGGRKKGTPNKTTTQLKEAILAAAERAGGKEGLVGYLERLANSNAPAFATLLGKVLPMTLAGDRDAPLQERVTVAWEAVDPPKRTE